MYIFWIRRTKCTGGSSWQEKDSEMRTPRPPLYLRTTDEMLEEFSYLGSAKAREIVIDNPNRICDMVEKDPLRSIRTNALRSLKILSRI